MLTKIYYRHSRHTFTRIAAMQGHLEKLSTNAKSIHHVLAALCGGLDRLERKIDTSSSQVRSGANKLSYDVIGTIS